jgi:hypothetical protein
MGLNTREAGRLLKTIMQHSQFRHQHFHGVVFLSGGNVPAVHNLIKDSAMATRTKPKPKTPATKKAGSAAVKKSAAKKTPAKSAPAKATAKAKPTGNRLLNLTYAVKDCDRKMTEGSARSKVHAFVAAAGPKGINRVGIEKHFAADESVPVKGALDYLVKVGLLTTIPV